MRKATHSRKQDTTTIWLLSKAERGGSRKQVEEMHVDVGACVAAEEFPQCSEIRDSILLSGPRVLKDILVSVKSGLETMVIMTVESSVTFTWLPFLKERVTDLLRNF